MPSEKQVVLVGTGGPTEAGWHQFESHLRCPKEYQLKNVRHIKPVEGGDVQDALAIGSFFHAGRARWFRSGFKTDAKTWQAIVTHMQKEAELLQRPASLKALVSATQYVKEYCEHWSMRPLPTPRAIEYKLGPAPFVEDLPFDSFRTARLDDISNYAEAGNALCIGEAKTTSSSVNDCINEYTLHGQPMLQQLLFKLAKQGEARFKQVRGTMLDICVKGYGGKRCQFAREFLPLNGRALAWFQGNLAMQLRNVNKLQWDSTPERRVSSCTRTYGRMRKACDYRPLCMHGRSASGGFTFADGASLLTFKPGADKKAAPWD